MNIFKLHPNITATVKVAVLCWIVTIAVSRVYAEGNERSVSLEWAGIDGATSYEVRIIRKYEDEKKGKWLNFPVSEPKWKATVSYGKYDLQLRSFDDRNVPGDWSPPQEFIVRPIAPLAIYPKNQNKVLAKAEDEFDITIKWQRVNGAKRYRVSISDTQGDFSQIKITSSTEHSFELPVARDFLWSVVAIMADGTEGEKRKTPYSFKFLGKPIEKPQIEKPLSKFVKDLQWTKPDYADRFNYAIYRKVNDGHKWKRVKSGKGLKNTKIPFDFRLPSGDYKIKVQAKGKNRKSSKVAEQTFPVEGGFRTPAAVEQAILKDSLSKPTDFYAIASYFISQVNYSNTQYDTDDQSSFTGLSGTGRLGVGYQKPESSWGGMFVADYGGINIGGENYTFSSLEIHATYKIPVGGAGVLLLDSGLYSKEVPQLVSQDGQSVQNVEIAQNIGPHIGVKYWLPFTEKIGMQLNARAYYSLSGRAPNGQDINPTLSYQAGVLGSLRLRKNLMGYAGYAFRIDRTEYSSDPNAQIGSRASQDPNLVNSIELQGNYLNLILEYSF